MKKVKMALNEDAERIPGYLLWRVSKLWQKKLEDSFNEFGLSQTQVILLSNIVRFNQEGLKLTQIMLAEKTNVDPVTTSQTVRVLEKKGLIKRATVKSDKRAYYILPTKEGIELTANVIKKLPKIQDDFFQPIAQDIDKLVILLQKLLNKKVDI
jgi:DNA-binding MarR family transcriptional regulator